MNTSPKMKLQVADVLWQPMVLEAVESELTVRCTAAGIDGPVLHHDCRAFVCAGSSHLVQPLHRMDTVLDLAANSHTSKLVFGGGHHGPPRAPPPRCLWRRRHHGTPPGGLTPHHLPLWTVGQPRRGPKVTNLCVVLDLAANSHLSKHESEGCSPVSCGRTIRLCSS